MQHTGTLWHVSLLPAVIGQVNEAYRLGLDPHFAMVYVFHASTWFHLQHNVSLYLS